jgi:methenyltetrahydromethanopterin cyclohydrolase
LSEPTCFAPLCWQQTRTAAIARSVALQLAQIARAKHPRYKILELYYQHGTKLAFNRCIAPVESVDVRNVKATNFRIGFVSNIWYSLRQHSNAHNTLHRLNEHAVGV